jgi:hypothetical protein
MVVPHIPTSFLQANDFFNENRYNGRRLHSGRIRREPSFVRMDCQLPTAAKRNVNSRVKVSDINFHLLILQTNKLRGLRPRANYTDRETAACRRS